jgi:hypothetical protein
VFRATPALLICHRSVTAAICAFPHNVIAITYLPADPQERIVPL